MGFILVGIAAGPSLLGVIPGTAVVDLKLIDDFALALIAMLAGGELQLKTLRPQAKVILLTTLVVTAIVWVGVAGTVLAGEISLAAAISSLDWVSSHDQYGRNDPRAAS